MSPAPETIPFNAIDHSYLIPETEDTQGNYFPMSPICVVKLKETVSKEQIITALQTLIEKYPQLRLAYLLDYEEICWRRVPDTQLSEYLDTCVHIILDDSPIETVLSKQIAINNEPLSQPVQIFIVSHYLLLRIHHSFGDGKFFNLMLQLLISELKGIDVGRVHLSKIWWKSIGTIIWDTARQGMAVMWQFAKSLFGYYQDYQQDTQSDASATRAPIKSASPMAVKFKTISPDYLKMLKESKQNLSLNTLLQVIVGEHLKRLNLQDEPITYTIPVDLRRYLKELKLYYPSNMASQIRVTLGNEQSLFKRAASLQTQINEQLEKRMALAAIPGEWLLLLSGKKNYQAVNRDWLLKSTHNDRRTFVLSNLGNLDNQFEMFKGIIADDFAPQIVIPLMGSPSLVFCFNTFCGQGNIVLTYDPQLYNQEQIDQVLSIFDTLELKNILQEIAD